MDIDQKEIMKIAASQLRSLSQEVKIFRETEERRTLVEAILSKTASDWSGQEVLEKQGEFLDKELEELKIIDKAVELQKTGELNLGSLSSQSSVSEDDLDPLTAYLVEDYVQ